MTEGHEDDCLVRVRGQVMARDESTEGWVPLNGGGLANVSIRKRIKLPPELGAYEHIIYGQRISDQTVILSCAVNGDLRYYKVMPTFHHWQAGKQRYGLTFQTAADARAFDKGLTQAYDALSDGTALKNGLWKINNKYDKIIGEDDVFMTLELPLDTSESRSSSEGGSQKSTTERPPKGIHIISSEKLTPPSTHSRDEQFSRLPSKIICSTGGTIPNENYSYVQLNTAHDYNYPVMDEPPIMSSAALSAASRRDSLSSLKKRANDTPPESLKDSRPIKAQPQRLRCRYCQEIYSEDKNNKGSCDFAPDCFKTGLETISGMKCARCMLYHCMSDSEGETPAHPCECSFESGCTKRWFGLALLSLVVPCLLCYPPLRACHWVGVSCGICGGKHQPQA